MPFADCLLSCGAPATLVRCTTSRSELNKRLFAAAHADDLKLAKQLLDAGADPEAKDWQGQCLLHRTYAQPAMTRLLLEAGAHPDAPSLGSNPLHMATSKGQIEVMRILLAAGADVSQPDVRGLNLIHLCIPPGRADCASLLLDAGADPAQRVGDWQSPLDYLFQGNKEDLARVVMNHPRARRFPNDANYQRSFGNFRNFGMEAELFGRFLLAADEAALWGALDRNMFDSLPRFQALLSRLPPGLCDRAVLRGAGLRANLISRARWRASYSHLINLPRPCPCP